MPQDWTPAAGTPNVAAPVDNTSNTTRDLTLAEYAQFKALVSGDGKIGPVDVTGTPTAGQVVVATSSTTAAWDDVEGAGSSAEQPPLVALSAKLATIASGVSAIARILTIGDSVSADISLPLIRPMMRAYGNAGVSTGSEQIGFTTTRAGGAAVTASNDFTVWPGGKWTEIPSGGTLTYQWNTAHITDYPVPASGVYPIGYLTFSGGGTFSVQDSADGSTWATIQTIDTNAAAGYVAATVTGTAGRRYLRLLGVSGTSRIVSWMIGATAGHRTHLELSIGGSSLSNYMLAPSAVWDSYLTACAPDLIFVYFKDDVDAGYTAGLTALQARILANCPSADVVYIGPTNADGDITNPSDPNYYKWSPAGRAAVSAHVATITGMRAWYWDASQVWGTWAQGNALGLYTDGTHPNDYGRIVLAEQFCRDFCLFQNPTANLPWKLSATQIAFAGGFVTTGGTISGATRVSDATDASGGVESTGAGAVRTAGGVYAAKTIKSDTGIAVGTDLGSVNSAIIAKTIGSAAWAVAGYTLNTSSHNSSGSYNWTGISSIVNVNHTGSVTNTGTIRGSISQVKESAAGTGNLTRLEAHYALCELSGSHPVSTATAVTAEWQSYGAGNVANGYGVRVLTTKGGTSVVTNMFGVHLPSSLTGTATNTWAFYNDSTAPSLSKGPWTWRPAASVTLAANGDFAVEMTSDTAGNLVYRGSDGTTRRAALVFA